jgi:hypothetical protein
MTHELIGEYPATEDREQMGRFLRHAFPLGLGSFAELPTALEGEESPGNTAREVSRGTIAVDTAY